MGKDGLVSFCGDWRKVWWRRRGVRICLGVMGWVLMLRGGIRVGVVGGMEEMGGDKEFFDLMKMVCFVEESEFG